MSIPSFVDRLNVSVQKEVVSSFFTEPISKLSTTVIKTIGVDPNAIAPADAGFIILATTSIYVKDSNAEVLRPTDFTAGAATKLVGASGGDLYIQMSVNTNDTIVVSEQPVIFVAPTPQTVFWS